MAFVRIALAEEIPPGRTAFRYIDSTPVLLANVGGQFFALHGFCPHRGYPLDGACLYEYLLDCPWHHFEYNVRTGENHYPRNVYPSDIPRLQEQLRPLRTYTVDVRGGEIWVDLT